MNETADVAVNRTAQIRAFLARYIRGQFADDADLFATGRINSLFAIQLVTFVEKQFRFRVEREDLDLKNFRSLNAICDFVDRKLAAP